MKTVKIMLPLLAALMFGNGVVRAQNEAKHDKPAVEVVVFHGVKQCQTCQAIKKNSQEVAEELAADGKNVSYRVVDFSKPEGKDEAKKYEIAWTSLLLIRHDAGDKETVRNISKFAIENARTNTEKFRKQLAEDIGMFVGALSPTDRRRRRPKEKRPKSWLDPERLKNRIKFVCCFYLGCWGIKSELSALLECLDALGADILAAENDDIPGVITENAGGLIFFQNDGRSIHIDLQGVFLRDIQCTAQFDGKDDTAQLIDLPDNAGRFQCDHSFLPSSCPSRQNDRCGFAVIMYDFGN